jgi:cell division transport system permease protein
MSEAFTGLRRNVSMVVSVVLVTFVSLTFVGAAILMQMQIGTMRDFWVERAQVAVYMCTSISTPATCSNGEASPEQVVEVRAKLEGSALAPLIRDLTFLDHQAAYDELLQIAGEENASLITPEQVNETFRITLVDPEQSDVIIEAFSGMQGVELVKDQMQYLDPLFSALTIATYIAVGIAVLMLIAAVLLIATTIRLSAFARRRELGIMRLVGASNRFIQTPFILEGVFAAVIGSVLAGIATWGIVKFFVQGYLQASIPFTNFVGTGNALTVAPILVIAAIVVAAIASNIAISRYLRV